MCFVLLDRSTREVAIPFCNVNRYFMSRSSFSRITGQAFGHEEAHGQFGKRVYLG